MVFQSHRRWTTAAWAWALACTQVAAQGNAPSMAPPVLVNDPCKRDVLVYQSNIELVRKTLGDKAAAEQDARFMSKAEWDATLLKEGYCGLSRRLRERKLVH